MDGRQVRRRAIRRKGAAVATAAVLAVMAGAAWSGPPERIGSWAEGPALAVARDGDLAVVSQGRTVHTYDIADPSAPVELGSVTLPGIAVDLEVAHGFLYAASLATGISVVDVRDPAAPRLMPGGVDLSPYGASDVTVDGTGLRAFVLTPRDGDLLVYGLDLQDPDRLVELWRLAPSHSSAIVATAVDGDLVHVLEPGTLRIFLEAPHDASELGSVDLAYWGAAGNLAVGGGGAYVGYHFMNWEWVLEALDVGDPAAPVSVGVVRGAASALGMAVDPDRGLLVSCGPDLYLASVVDPGDPRLLATYDGSRRDLVDLSLGDGVVIAAAGEDGVHVVDVADPAAPAALAVIESAGAAGRLDWHGTTLQVDLGRNGVQLLDATDPARPIEMARLPAIPEGTSAWRTHVATGGIVLQSARVVTPPDGGQEIYGVLRSLDVSDPRAPVVLDRVEIDDVSDTALTDGLLLVATRESLVVVDVADPAALTLVGSLANGASQVTSVGTNLALTFFDEGITNRLDVVDLSDPTRPAVLGTLNLPDRTRVAGVARGPWSTVSLAVRAEVIPGEQFLAVVDLGQPSMPTILGRLALGGEPTAIAQLGLGRVAVADVGPWPTGSTVLVVDTSSPHDMRVVDRLREVSRVRDLAVRGNLLAMAADDAGVTLWDVSGVVPAAPRPDDAVD